MVPAGAGGDWCGASSGMLMSPGVGAAVGWGGDGGETGWPFGLRMRVGCGKNVGLLLISGKSRWVSVPGLQRDRRCCRSTAVPKSMSPKLPPVLAVAGGRLRTPLGFLFSPSSEGCRMWHFCAFPPSEHHPPLRSHPSPQAGPCPQAAPHGGVRGSPTGARGARPRPPPWAPGLEWGRGWKEQAAFP